MQNFFLIAPILFLYYELSVCPLILNYNKVYLAASLIAKPSKKPSLEPTYLLFKIPLIFMILYNTSFFLNFQGNAKTFV